MLGWVATTVDKPLRATAALFEPSARADRAKSWEIAALLLLIVAGGIVRFWGLGSWGLEYDEETMAMPVMHIVEHGSPQLPSGMTYVRAIGQLYLMAASVIVFGESEWSFRLPSVICGLLLIPLVFLMGRRFLTPTWNLALTATATFLPTLIADSQEARMYIFMLACITGLTVLVFKWEQTGLFRYCLAAVAVAVVGLQFHTLTVFAGFLLFFPGLLHADRKKLLQGSMAFAAVAVAYVLVDAWTDSFYPPLEPHHGMAKVADSHLSLLDYGISLPLGLVGVAVALLMARYMMGGVQGRGAAIATGLLVFAGLCCQLMFFQHLGVLLLLAGVVVAYRHGSDLKLRLAALVVVSAAISVVSMYWLYSTSGLPPRKLIGAVVGLPSIWPYFHFARYSLVASAVVFVALVHALWLLAHRRQIADVWLFFVLAIAIPLFGMGLFAWNVEQRYTEFGLLPLLLCAFAALPRARLSEQPHARTSRRPLMAVAALGTALIAVNPISVARTVNAGYSMHPDHKGAAQYIQSLRLGPNDVLLAEDVLQQTYYLGKVDYWLVGLDTAQRFCQLLNGRMVDIYTHTPVISSGPQLRALVDNPKRGTIYILGSGEQQVDGRRSARSFGIFEELQKSDYQVIYMGRDGLTKIWKVPPPQQSGMSNPSATMSMLQRDLDKTWR